MDLLCGPFNLPPGRRQARLVLIAGAGADFPPTESKSRTLGFRDLPCGHPHRPPGRRQARLAAITSAGDDFTLIFPINRTWDLHDPHLPPGRPQARIATITDAEANFTLIFPKKSHFGLEKYQAGQRPRAQRTRTRPQKPTNSDGNPTRGPSVGGIAYERTKICKSVQPPSRCYTLGPSAEAPTSIVAPVASAKMPTEEIDADAAMRQRVLTSGAVIAVAAFSEAPPIVRERIREVQSLVNFPAIGVSNNYAYATSQANVASAKQPLVPPAGKRGLRKHGKATRLSLATDMGFYGGAHTDRKDSAGHYSHMSVNSDLPEGYTPGFFFILELGVFIQLDSHASINFSGLRRHGGTPPLCSSAPGAKLYKFAYRFVLIFYPPTRMVNGTARWTLGAMPNNEVFIFPPEMLHAGVSNRIAKGWPATSSCQRASFVREGVLMMSQEALVTFIIRSLLLLCYYFLLQLPARYKVRLDPDIFLQSITMQVDGQRVNTGPWEFAPGHRLPEHRRTAWVYTVDCPDADMVDQDQVRSDAWARWDAWTAVVATHIPSVGHRGPLKHHIPQLLNLKEGDGYDGGDEQEEEDDVSEPELGDPKRRPKPKLRTGPKEGSKKKRAKKVIVEVATEEGESATDLEEGAGVESGGGGQSDSSGSGSTSEPEASNDNNTDLRTKDTDPDTSQDRVLRSGTTFSKGAVVRTLPNGQRIGEPAESDCDDSRDNETVGGAVSGGRAQSKKRKEISETEEPQLGKRVRKARVGNTEDASLVVIEALNLHAIKRNLHDVETAWEAASQAVATTLDLQELDIAYSALLQHPDASSTTTYFPSIWRGLNRMNGLHAMTSLRTRLDRECIMLTTFFAWRWLDVFCPQKIQEAVEARRQSILPTMWIGKLACDVAAVLERRADHHTFIASKYGFALASAEFNFSNKRCEILVDNKALLEATTTHTAQIIASWLEFPVGGVSRYQAWFVEAITQTIGLRALLLDEVWRAYVQIRKYVLGDSIARPHCLRQFQTLLLQLRAHPLAQASSSEADVLSRLAQVMELVRAPAAAPLSLMDVDEIPDSDSHPQLPDNSTAQALTASALTLPHPAIALYSLSKTPSAPAQQKLAVFMQFLDEALAATRQGHGLTEWQSFMLSNMDRLCPFRELAPSRQCAAGPLGPYTSDFAATQSGFLSALIFRAITFNTDFLATAWM
ncbi:hypothetical protein B0H12DRAFT_1328701 [Mycena haematopus]|nr:hypothetical protein B0H12DRAFT_1328701 [Mycena haematopus]